VRQLNKTGPPGRDGPKKEEPPSRGGSQGDNSYGQGHCQNLYTYVSRCTDECQDNLTPDFYFQYTNPFETIQQPNPEVDRCLTALADHLSYRRHWSRPAGLHLEGTAWAAR